MRLQGGRTGVRAVVCEKLELTGLMAAFDLEISYGERVAVLGGNGSGKSHFLDRKSTRLNSSHRCISYAVFCLKKKINKRRYIRAALANGFCFGGQNAVALFTPP